MYHVQSLSSLLMLASVRALIGAPPPVQEGEIWMLGRRYECGQVNEWPSDFIRDVDGLIYLRYRTGFVPIPRDPQGPSPLTLRSFVQTGNIDLECFHSDVGWGCMIRTGQSLLANTLKKLSAIEPRSSKELELIRKFSDEPDAQYSIHKFVLTGSKFGKRPGEWFGPSAVARCIRALTLDGNDVAVYISEGQDVYEEPLIELLQNTPVLVLCGLRLGISQVNPVYYDGLRRLLQLPQSVGIAGGSESSSLYFYGCQNDRLLYHDPHVSHAALNTDTNKNELFSSVHAQQLNAVDFGSTDPSMLAGFLLKSIEDFKEWKEALEAVETKSRAITVHAGAPPSRPADFESVSEDEDDYVVCESPKVNDDSIVVGRADISLRREKGELVQPQIEESIVVERP